MSDELIRTTGDWLSVLRARISAKGLTHLEVDELAGLAHGHTGAILRGKRLLRTDTLMKLCGGLGIAAAAVVEREEKIS